MLLYLITFQLRQEVYQSRRRENVASIGDFLQSTVTNLIISLESAKSPSCNFYMLCKNYCSTIYVFFKKFKMSFFEKNCFEFLFLF